MEMYWNTLGLFVILLVLVWFSQETRHVCNLIPRRKRGKEMRRERRNYVRRLTIDAIVDFVELQVWNGTFTRAEARELYRDARKYWPVKDLFPDPQLLKNDIKKRLDSGSNAPVDLPPKKERKVSFKRTVRRDNEVQNNR